MTTRNETLADARDQKNFEDRLADYQAKKLQEKNQKIIEYYESEIQYEKDAVKICLDQNMFSFAKSALTRIEEYKSKIDSLR